MADWSFLTTHARALLFIAHEPDARLRNIADALDVTERTTYGIVADLADAGYVVKHKDGRRNRYTIQSHLPLPGSVNAQRTIGDMLDLLVHDTERRSGERRRDGATAGATERRTTRGRRAEERPAAAGDDEL